jgi:hypothetical protein
MLIIHVLYVNNLSATQRYLKCLRGVLQSRLGVSQSIYDNNVYVNNLEAFEIFWEPPSFSEGLTNRGRAGKDNNTWRDLETKLRVSTYIIC